MTNCQNLCTAEKCQELERRITELETRLNQHLSDNIPIAHQWDGDLTVSLFVNNKTLTVEVYIDNIGEDSTSIELPFVTQLDSTQNNNIAISGFIENKNLFLSIANGVSQDTTTIALPFVFQDDFDEHLRLDIPNAHDYNPLINVNTAIESNTLFVDVAIDNSSDVATVELPVFEPLVNVSLGIEENTLFVDVAVDNSSDTGTIELPTSNLKIDGIFQNNYLYLTVADRSSQDTTQILIPIPEIKEDEMNCHIDSVNNSLNELNNTVQRENNENQARIDGLTFQLDLRVGEINDLVNRVLNELNQSINNNFVVGNCQEVTTEDNESVAWGEMTYTTVDTAVSGSGISGIAQLIKVINSQISALHQDLCHAIPPNFNLKNVTPLTCLEQGEAPLTTENFLATDTDFNYLLTEFQGEEDNAPQPNTVTLRKNLYHYLAYKLYLLQEQQINLFQLTCNSDLSTDVVSIIANDKVVNRVSSTQLILHFVTLDNYPKRARNSSYRPVQIPGAKKPTTENPLPYDWIRDFEDFYWIQGNQYAELRFEENYAPVSGWFENAVAANVYFDKVLTLTTATEANRVIPVHSNPKTDIPVRTTRPYRAFICELNSQGQNQCLTKYQPII